MTANVVPMAGLGSRFTADGYLLPKPLVPVSGEPMIIKAIRSMPPADKWVFLVREEHIDEYALDEVLKQEIPSCIIVPVKELTQGQACTCMLAMPYLEPNESVYIGSCDTAAEFDQKTYDTLSNSEDVDCIVWTMTQQPTMKVRPEKHGWCKLEAGGFFIQDMSVKVPVSQDPFNDHAVIGSFWFRRVQDFVDATNLMIAEDYRANNEFFVDSLPVFMKKLGKQSVIFDVDIVVSWGTPKDLYFYQYMDYCLTRGLEPQNVPDAAPNLHHWKRYFGSQ